VGRIANGWRLAKSSWRVLSRDRELVSIPIVAGFISLVVFAIVAGAGALLVGDNDSADWALWIILALASVLAMWVSVIGQAAVISGAGERMDGGDPTLGSAFAGARGRTGRLLEWAVLATAVSIILDTIRDRLGFAGQIIAGIGNMAFQVLSFLALPVIVFENVGAIESFRRSSKLLRSTWGEQLARDHRLPGRPARHRGGRGRGCLRRDRGGDRRHHDRRAVGPGGDRRDLDAVRGVQDRAVPPRPRPPGRPGLRALRPLRRLPPTRRPLTLPPAQAWGRLQSCHTASIRRTKQHAAPAAIIGHGAGPGRRRRP
jgi:Family of unknown function (DUF6159)